MALRRKSMSVAEEDAFKMMYDDLIEDIMSDPTVKDIREIMEWIKHVMDYNVPHGKQIRGRGVVAAYRFLVEKPKQEDIKLTYVLGWCIEIFQAFFLMTDDIIDNSEVRRGNPCWYLIDGIGDLAINDSFLLTGILYYLIDKYFYEKDYYPQLCGLFHMVHYRTSLGQTLDINASKEVEVKSFKLKHYMKMVQYKTCYYTFYFPVACAMIMAGKKDPEDWAAVEELVLEIGLMFQVQDDYLDLFGDPAQTGKMGTDIAENKRSWLLLTAYSKADESQKKRLLAHYGKGSKTTDKDIQEVIAVFNELNMKDEFRQWEEELYSSIHQKIRSLSHRIPKDIFQETTELIYKRVR